MGILLTLALSAAPTPGPTVALQSDGAAPCDSGSFARALRTLRPELSIVAIDSHASPPPPGAWSARLTGVAFGEPVLQVSGNPTPLSRPLGEADCRRALELAASIVDGLLDQLPRQASGPLEPARVAASRLRPGLEVWVGGGALQGPIQWVGSVALGLRLALGNWEVVGAADLGFLSTVPLVTGDEGLVGIYKALPFDFEVGGGYAPRLGPGKLSLDVLAGPAAVRVWSKGSPLFVTETPVSVEAFVGLSAAYTVDLPARFFVGVRIEERWAPVQAHFGVDTTDGVVTRAFTFTPDLLVGWRLR